MNIRVIHPNWNNTFWNLFSLLLMLILLLFYYYSSSLFLAFSHVCTISFLFIHKPKLMLNEHNYTPKSKIIYSYFFFLLLYVLTVIFVSVVITQQFTYHLITWILHHFSFTLFIIVVVAAVVVVVERFYLCVRMLHTPLTSLYMYAVLLILKLLLNWQSFCISIFEKRFHSIKLLAFNIQTLKFNTYPCVCDCLFLSEIHIFITNTIIITHSLCTHTCKMRLHLSSKFWFHNFIERLEKKNWNESIIYWKKMKKSNLFPLPFN